MNYEIAQAALTYYDLPKVQLSFLEQSQNTTFRVETPAKEMYLLRLHIGVKAAGKSLYESWKKPSIIESELLWLNAIAQDTELTVPQPVQNRLGDWVTNIVGTQQGVSIPCSLLQWVDGEHLGSEPTAQQIWQLDAL
ncbi:hypothetical protein U2F10_35355 [Leptothoe sp. EHU-05/26/07-4]